MNICQCGCGRPVNSKFRRGHNLRAANPLDIVGVKEKISLARMGQAPWNKGRTGLQVGWNKGLKGSVAPNKTSFKIGLIPWNKGMKGIKGPIPKGTRFSPEFRRKLSLAHKGQRPWNKGKRLSDEHRRKLSTPEVVRRRMIGQNRKPNKPEIKLIQLISFYKLPFKYVGDGRFLIEAKCPDFVNVNGKKQVIELYGDYWHKNEDPRNRINLFAEYGFATLVIWEHELNDVEKVARRIKEFAL